jgi:hypothetical protein
MERVIAFPKNYTLVLGKMKAGNYCKPLTSKMEDGTIFVKEV